MHTICPSFPLPGGTLKTASVSITEVLSVPHSGGNFPKGSDSLSLLALSNARFQKDARAHARYTHARMLMRFICLCAEQTPRCVSLASRVMMMKGTCCSQQKPLSTLCYRHPACIIHKSSGNSVTSRRVSTFATRAEGKRRTAEWIHALV